MGDFSQIIFEGKAILGDGISLSIEKGVTLRFGLDFYCNSNCLFRCADDVVIGNNVLFGWNVSLNTTDGHLMMIDNILKNNHGSICIGNHTWVASNTILCKNISIGCDCIIAQNSLVNHKFTESNLLIGGIPAKILRKNVKRLD